MHNLVRERIDEGVDDGGYGNVFALGSGKVAYVVAFGRWFKPAPNDIAYKLAAARLTGTRSLWPSPSTPRWRSANG